MRRILSIILCLALTGLPAMAAEWKTDPPAKSQEEKKQETLDVTWEGEMDLDMLKAVRSDIARAHEGKHKTLRVALLSGGGPVLISLEIARLVREAHESGLVVEIRGISLVASGATFVLAAGTPGRRFISRWAFFLIHAPQAGGFMASPRCVTFSRKPESVEERLENAILILMRDSYMRYTGRSQEEVERWLTCGSEQIGSGELAVQLGIADALKES